MKQKTNIAKVLIVETEKQKPWWTVNHFCTICNPFLCENEQTNGTFGNIETEQTKMGICYYWN